MFSRIVIVLPTKNTENIITDSDFLSQGEYCDAFVSDDNDEADLNYYRMQKTEITLHVLSSTKLFSID